ncbi:MAG: CRISPR-associated RAMP protein Csx7 [Bacillota bacterium]
MTSKIVEGVLRVPPNCLHLEKLSSLTILQGTLVCQTAVRIGTGDQVIPGGADMPVLKDAAGRPFIPGSSLKGVLRSFAERLVVSLVPVGEKVDYNTFDAKFTSCLLHTESHFCLSTCRALQQEFTSLREKNKLKTDCAITAWIKKRTCSVCRFFGSPYLAGRVWVKDAFVVGEPQPLEVRAGVAIDRDRRAAAAGLLYDLEVVPPGTRFEVEIRAENATETELGLLFLSLEQLDRAWWA